jgi:hypothetical protein
MSHQVQLCQMQLARMGPEGVRLVDGLTQLGAQVQRVQCLSLCFPCGNQIVARVDGAPVGAPSVDSLVDELRAAFAA